MEFSVNKTMVTLSLPTPPPPPPSLNMSKMVEGGFFSGRNPFEFNPGAPLPTFIVQLLIIICMSRLIKFILSPIRQPSVIAEIISGIVLGPTVFGHIPGYINLIFPKASLPFLNLMSNFGLVLFLFLVGLELDPAMLKKSMKQCLSISLAGMLLPFSCGAAASYALYDLIEPHDTKVTFIKYFLFLGVAISITAFPVLARILTELNLLKTKVGSITISAAAADDATSWCLLALIISLINAGSAAVAVYVFVVGLCYTLFILLALRPLYIWILHRTGSFKTEPSQGVMCMTLMLVFTSAFITDALGIHAIFGGFLVGIMVPHDRGLAFKITQKLEDIVSVIFLPLYFALSGLKTHVGSLSDGTSWGLLLLVIFVACAGKIAGCTTAAKLSNLSWRESFAVGVLMNCKGLVELIVLNLGFDAGIISEKTFAIMVLMALFTTFLTVPIVSYVYPPQYHEFVSDSMGEHGGTSSPPLPPPTQSESNLLVCVNDVEHVPSILKVINLLESIGREKTTLLYDTKNGGIRTHSVPFKESQLAISALRLIEITERDSSVMIQTSPESILEDPVMKMLGAFGQITCLNIEGLLQVATAANFGTSILRTAAEVGAGFIIIPWEGSLPIYQNQEDTGANNVGSRSGQMVTTPKYGESMQEILTAKPTATILILVASESARVIKNEAPNTPQEPKFSVNGLVSSYQKIFLLFFGGADDHHALQVVMAAAAGGGGPQQESSVNIVRFKISAPNSVARNAELRDKSTGEILNGFSWVRSPTEDQRAVEIFDQLSNHNGGPTVTAAIRDNVIYTEIETSSPIPKITQFVQGLDNNCLVIVGRTHDGFDMRAEAGQRQADPERRKILGDVAESILLAGSTANVLIVQAGSTNGLK